MAEEENKGIRLFGYEIKKSKADKKEDSKLKSIVPPTDEDGEGYVTASAGHFGHYINIEGDKAKDSRELIMKYRGVAMHPEVDMAIDEIVNEVITASELQSSINVSFDGEEISESIKKKIREEFREIVSMMRFNEFAHDIFKSWYIDGRIYHHLLVDEANLKKGIQEIRHIDATKIKKVKKVKYKKDEKTGVEIVDSIDEYYVYENTEQNKFAMARSGGVKISPEAISYVTSGLLDETKKKVISHLHKAIKPVNQLRMMEDSLVIYRLARAPERRIFYIDTGNLQKGKADEYIKGIMAKHRNKLVYDAATGQIKDDRKHMSMLEDFWLPRREGGRGTEITTLPGGQNLGEIDDIVYFQKNLYRSLNVPINRLEQEAQFSLGRSSEITRDELKFQKFVDRLRRRFGSLFLNILKKQLVLKNIITEEDWEDWKDYIVVDFIKDNNFTELKESELLRERIATLNDLEPLIGTYFTKKWVMKKVLRFDDEEIEELEKELEKEKAAGEHPDLEAELPQEEPPKPKKDETDDSEAAKQAIKTVPDEKST